MFDDLLHPIDTGIQIELSQQKRHELRYIGSVRKRISLITFSYNKVTGEIKPAEIKRCNTIDFLTLEPLYSPKIIVERDCIYLQCMNVANCIRHLKTARIFYLCEKF